MRTNMENGFVCQWAISQFSLCLIILFPVVSIYRFILRKTTLCDEIYCICFKIFRQVQFFIAGDFNNR